MKTPPDHIDYGIYIDHRKAYIILLNEFDKNVPPAVHVEWNMNASTTNTQDEQKSGSKVKEEMDHYCQAIIGKLKHPHRIVIFGPSEAKYELHEELQKEKLFEGAMKELVVTDQMDHEDLASRFIEKYFASRLSF